ncbi:MAG: ATP-binding cassette domain-containing protein, partial [Betaproteobacteria bacterium]|nr:ATP-binding cassette domain-containing protein [Betaproteobacteria bacterium]
MLELSGVHSGYGGTEVLFGLNLSIAEGEVATLLGRNGMGKTTTLRTILGLLP